jgi:hypothetical protein
MMFGDIYWTSGAQAGCNGRWFWCGSERWFNSKVEKWGPDQPDAQFGEENCMTWNKDFVLFSGTLYDFPCFRVSRYLCEVI